MQHLKAALKPDTLVWPSVPTHEPLLPLSLFTSPQSIILSLQLHTELFTHVVSLSHKTLFSAAHAVSKAAANDLNKTKTSHFESRWLCSLSPDWLIRGELRGENELTLPKGSTYIHTYTVHMENTYTPTCAHKARRYVCWLDSKHTQFFHIRTAWSSFSQTLMLLQRRLLWQHVSWREELHFKKSQIKQMHFDNMGKAIGSECIYVVLQKFRSHCALCFLVIWVGL